MLTGALCLLMLANYASPKRSDGLLISTNSFAYLDRFCFQSETGALEYTLTYPATYNVHNLLLYFDTEDQWPRAYKELTTCEERMDLLRKNERNNQIIRLDPYQSRASSSAKCRLVADNISAREFVQCQGARGFQSMRSRWWFLAIATCDDEDSANNTQGIEVQFELRMTNGEPSNFIRYQFSDDEWLILPTDVGFLVVHAALLIMNFAVGCQLSNRRLYHNTYRMATQAFVLETAGLGTIVLAYCVYAYDGVGLPFMKLIGQLFRAIGSMFFVFTVLVLSRGLNVVKMRLSKIENLVLGLLILFFLSAYVGMLFWEIRGFDPALVYYQSESLPGYLLAVWRLIAWVFFFVSAILTWRHHPVKRKFYTSFIFLFTPWFFAGPIVLVIANFVLNNWVREGVVNIVDNCVITYGFVIFMYISWPSSANQNFPFHIRTTQVNCDFDPHTNYAPSDKDQKPEDDIQMNSMRPQITTAHDDGISPRSMTMNS